MKVQLIYINTESERGEFYPGIASLSAVLKAEGHKVDLIHLKAKDKPHIVEKIINSVKKFGPDIIGFTLTELQEKYLRILSKKLKENFEISIIVGGPYATLCPESIINLESVDMVVRGDGERVLTNLLFYLEYNKPINEIRGLWVKDRERNKIYKNPLDNPLEIDTMPFPDRSIFDLETVTGDELKGEKTIQMMCSRGCPFSCTYCANKYIKSLYPQKSKYVRFHSVDYVIQEIRSLQEKYKFGAIGFYDDTFLLNKKWIDEFSKKYRNEIGLPFSANARPDICNNELVSNISKAGCCKLQIGIESGNEYIRKRILNREITNAQIIGVFKLARKYGLNTASYTMVGIPYETVKNIKETIKLNAKLKPNIMQISVFYPFKGTELGDLCYQKGWVIEERKEEIDTYFEKSILNYPQLSAEEIDYYYRNFYTFYCKYNYRIRMRRMLAETLKKLHLYRMIHPLWVKYAK